jgi:hypothetical protein|tara:strand:+ start:946 stop:1335 length:390 start_codon:yes stop_codon:yes gene_type:complete
MDGLSIITGISLTVFILLYFAFNTEQKEIRWFTIIAAIFLLSLVPRVAIPLENDCAILNNGSYYCYNTSGSRVNASSTSVTDTFYESYMWYLRIFAILLIILLFKYATDWLGWDRWKPSKKSWRLRLRR